MGFQWGFIIRASRGVPFACVRVRCIFKTPSIMLHQNESVIRDATTSNTVWTLVADKPPANACQVVHVLCLAAAAIMVIILIIFSAAQRALFEHHLSSQKHQQTRDDCPYAIRLIPAALPAGSHMFSLLGIMPTWQRYWK